MMADKTDWVGVGAIALVGYFLVKKINDFGTGAVNTATVYVEKVTEIVHQSTDTVKSYVPGTSTDSDKAYQEYKNTVNNVAAGVDAVSGVDTSDVSRYLYNAGGGYTDQKTGAYIPGAVTNPAYDSDSLQKYTGSAGSNKATVQSVKVDNVESVKVDNVVQVNPTKQTFETSAFSLEMPDYMVEAYKAAAGDSKSTGSSSTQAPTTVKASAGGYSVAMESGTTVNAGKYEPVKASSGGSSSTKAPTTVKASSGGYSVASESGTTVNAGKYEPVKVKK